VKKEEKKRGGDKLETGFKFTLKIKVNGSELNYYLLKGFRIFLHTSFFKFFLQYFVLLDFFVIFD